MVQRQLEILEARVAEMITRIKSLRSEKVRLQARLDQQGREFHELQEERSLIRDRVAKLLETLNHVGEKDGPA